MEDVRNMADLLDDPAACPAPTTAWDIRNLRRRRNLLNALQVIPASSGYSTICH
jgi:hypothetical protein